MFPIQTFLDRFGALLEQLDALTEDCAGDAAEDLDDLNAEFEDALMLLGEYRGDDDPEELSDALEDLKALAGDYRALSGGIPEIAALADQLEMAAEMALGNL